MFVQLPVLHQHSPQPCFSQSNFLSYTNTCLSHVRRSPISCLTPTLILAMFVAVQLPEQHQHSPQPYSSQSNFLSYTNTRLSHVRRSTTSCPTPTLISAMFVELQLPVLHHYSCQPCSSQSNFQRPTLTLISTLFVPVGKLILRNLINLYTRIKYLGVWLPCAILIPSHAQSSVNVASMR